MRALICSLVCFYLLLSSASGQKYDPNEPNRIVYGGLTAGANFSALVGDAYPGYHKLGFNGGAVVHARFNEFVGAGIELLYSQRGSRGVREIYSNYVGAAFEKYFLDLNYVELPVQVFAYPGKNFVLGAGLSYSRLLKVREDIATDQPVFLDPEKFPFTRNDYAFLGSVGKQLGNNWIVSLRYQQSLKPIRDWYNVPFYVGSDDQYNTWFTLRLTWVM